MSKPWTGTGLSDFNSWWPTDRGRGLVYRGDGDMEIMDTRHRLTLVEFKNAGEGLSRAQFSWLKVRAGQDNTEVRVVRELVGTDPLDNNRLVSVRVIAPTGQQPAPEVMTLQAFVTWAETRAYRA